MDNLLATYVLNGGPLMAVLIFCSFLLLGAIVQNLIRFREDRVAPKASGSSGATASFGDLRSRFQNDLSPLGKIVAAVSGHLLAQEKPASKDQLGELVDEATADVADELYENLSSLSTLYTVAPLIGLLGTILGMMSAFREFGAGDERDLAVLSQGIQQALVTTLWGLGIAIIAFVAVQYFQARIRRYERKALPEHARALLLPALGGPKSTRGETP